MIDLKLIGGRIRQLRQKRGLTQGELAQELAVSFQAVSNWERGIAPPDIENLIRIASFFGVLVDTLLSPQAEELYLGVDGGGTKTEFVLVSACGQVYKRLVKEGCNPNDAGYLNTERIISEGVNDLMAEYPAIKGVFCGIAGGSTGNYAERLRAMLKRILPTSEIQVMSDAFNLFALNDDADLVVISGTGSAVFAKNGDGFKRIGGWGYLFDKAGSAYDIGRDAISRALKEEDCGEPRSLLSSMLLKKMNASTIWEHINSLYSGGKPYIASFASTVFEAYLLNDEGAIKIIDNNGRALAEMLNTASELCGTNRIAVASGGLFEHYPEILREHIGKYSSVSLSYVDLPPVYGACKRACATANCKIADDFYENFKKSYGDIKK